MSYYHHQLFVYADDNIFGGSIEFYTGFWWGNLRDGTTWKTQV
jgi:hypothetical protein